MNVMHTLISAAVVVVLALPVYADVKEDLQGIKKEIKEKKNLLNKTRKVETQVSKELGTIEKSLHEKEAGLAALGRDLKVV